VDETERSVGEPEVERPWSQSVVRGDEACCQRGHRDCAVAGSFVEAHRESTLRRSDEIDLHDHRRRPRQPLVHAEKHVGDDDPTPRRCPDQQQRNRQSDDPAGHEDWLASEAVRERAGKEVRGRLHDAECDDERESGREGHEPEGVLGQQWKDRAFLSDHPADESVDSDEEDELRQVLPEAQPDRGA
jgi:hypothetical protein